jgi:CheY-like chemotaxis protein
VAHLILAADDDAVIQRLLEVNLELEGYDVVLASDGAEAVAVAEAHRPDLVLLDVMMPNLDGWQACADIRRIDGLEDVPVVFLSARAQQADLDRGDEVGASAYITKPFDPMELLDVVKDLLDASSSPEDGHDRSH